MRRKRFRKKPVAVAMLPFLAVLICTMGSLIVLLVILVQNARVEADTVKSRREQEETQQERALREKTEDAEWRKEILLEARERDAQKLSDARLELSHLEEHLRRLQSKWQELTRQVEDLERLSGDRQADTSAAKAELARLQAEIARQELQLEKARREAADRPRSFAIVPIPRTDGTLRRPIYVECTANGVILQPEGIVLGAKDFLPPLGPGNALDAALRATREYLARHGGVDAHGEPYPLLLVRPNGAIAYGAARDALRSWEHEFGYELLDEEMQLAYPDPDPALAEEVRRAVAMARQRQELLARSAPTRFRRLRQAMQDAGDPGDSLIGGGRGNGLGQGGDSLGGFGQGSDAMGQIGVGGGTPSGNRPQRGGSLSGGSSLSGGGRGESNSQEGFGGGVASNGGAANSGVAKGSPASGGGRQGTTAQGKPSGNPLGRASFGGGFFGDPSSAGSDARSASQNTQGQQRGDGPAPGAPSTRGGPATVNGGGNGGPLEGQGSTQSMAAKRGSNWALRDGGGRANAYTRPVRVALTPDRLYILPESRSSRPVKSIELQGAMVQHIEALVEAVHQQVDGWGTAPVRGYWRPVLTVQVAPGAERRFQELRTLLDDSGLQVERKAP